MSDLSLLLIGFSMVVGVVLLLAYLRSDQFPARTMGSVVSVIVLSASLLCIQWFHLRYLLGDAAPLQRWPYLVALFIAPSAFFLFGKAIVQPHAPFTRWSLLPLLPVFLPVVLPLQWALPILLLVGAGYALWLSQLVFRIRQQRRQRKFELLFSIAVTLSAGAVLLLGSALPWLNEGYFYQGYAISIGIAYVLITYALVAIPDFVRELFEVTQARYAVSSLGDLNVEATAEQLERLMTESHLYREDGLSLASLAAALEISAHQLSELLNGHLGCSFSQYLRRYRVAAAQRLLREHPEQSVLSVGLEIGFSSQSTFYAAFKQETGMSPGEYRKRAIS